METLVIKPRNKEQMKVFESMAKALNVPLQKTKGPYNPFFVAKIKQAEKKFSAGKYKTIKVDDLWK